MSDMKSLSILEESFLCSSFWIVLYQVKSQSSNVNKLFLFLTLFGEIVFDQEINKKSESPFSSSFLRKRGKSQLFSSGHFNNIISKKINIQFLLDFGKTHI